MTRTTPKPTTFSKISCHVHNRSTLHQDKFQVRRQTYIAGLRLNRIWNPQHSSTEAEIANRPPLHAIVIPTPRSTMIVGKMHFNSLDQAS
ncbi:hypothetical protein AVEN_231684-1 [Araneus ventricosus]|uniref:Uncharacterized protein n=1 Tax=Araneus ventricosus TaxID=182803 RepID=A0A4Y2T7A3_ARAVE|nr:hypothetical protein AVEN_56583-1 [Araneus ventricosus]GBN96507.1 hypothetical protein AVEN_231684-1 [Araneus ventricosus]